ncbi:MAG: SDR family oxidoreductase [Sedimentisphaerales bacterium]|nr:SDR family oxidoreductase [Sedimentisphaerales bacterium]
MPLNGPPFGTVINGTTDVVALGLLMRLVDLRTGGYTHEWLSLMLSREVQEYGITVNQAALGWTISEDCWESDSTRAYRENIPLKRRGTDREIAQVVALLAADLAGFISGAYIPVCGGNVNRAFDETQRIWRI